MNSEERVTEVEKRIDRGENRTDLIEQAILQMKDLVIRHEERLDDFHKALRESREDFEFKLNALIDAQLKNETEISELKEVSKSLEKTSKSLEEASKSQLTRIERLEDS